MIQYELLLLRFITPIIFMKYQLVYKFRINDITTHRIYDTH